MPRPQAGTRGTVRSRALQTVLPGDRDSRAGRCSDKVIKCTGDMVRRATDSGSWEYSVCMGEGGGMRERQGNSERKMTWDLGLGRFISLANRGDVNTVCFLSE